MRQVKEMTDEKRLALLNEYLSSGKSKNAFEKEKGLSHVQGDRNRVYYASI